MACSLTSGLTNVNCIDNTGGIQYIALGEWNGTNTTFTLGVDNIIATMSFTGGTVSFYKHEVENETASLNSTPQSNPENGTLYYEQTCEFTIKGLDAAKLTRIAAIASNRWRLLVLTQSGKWLIFGKQNGGRVSAGTIGVGKAFGDLNGAVLTFTAKEPSFPFYEVNASVATALITT